MSGPALRQLSAHHSIHEGACNEADELLQILKQTAAEGDDARTLEVAYVLLEHWETRTFRHAAAEEEGFYLEVLDECPELEHDIVLLKRDHELMRILGDEIKVALKELGYAPGILERFEAMLLINILHGREEEKRLLASGKIKFKKPAEDTMRQL